MFIKLTKMDYCSILLRKSSIIQVDTKLSKEENECYETTKIFVTYLQYPDSDTYTTIQVINTVEEIYFLLV